MKTVYITEDMLKESVLLDKLPEDIVSVAVNGKTSIGRNPALPEVFDDSFVEKSITKRFSDARERLLDIGEIDDVEETEMRSVLSRLIIKCQELEKPIRPFLEKLCYNYVISLFDIPSDSVTLELSLVDEIDYSKYTVNVDPSDMSDDGFEFDNVSQITDVRGEVYKRRLLNCLSMGAGMSMSNDPSHYTKDVNGIGEELTDIYNKVLALNDYLLFTKESVGITDTDKMQAGTVSVTLGGPDELVKVSAQGKILPILLSETIRGLFELFSSHGLPKDKALASKVVGRADFIKAEPWDMRIGPYLWDTFKSRLGNCDTQVLPYIVRNVSELDVKRFNEFFTETFAGTKTGRKLCWSLVSASEKEYKSNSDELMTKADMQKSVITDDHPLGLYCKKMNDVIN